MAARQFPWVGLSVIWLAFAIFAAAFFLRDIVAGEFVDPDDYLRMLQVRDLVAGQSWFDLTQHRINPPYGLPMHWSRLVDLPILVFYMPMRPLLGDAMAQAVSVTLAPLLSALGLLIALTFVIRRLIGPSTLPTMIGMFFALSAPAVFIQMHPLRIDHHSLQLVFAIAALAALLDRKPMRSGLLAGAFVAQFLVISIEGLPYAVSIAGVLGALWIAGRENSQRMVGYAAGLAGALVPSAFLLSPARRWTEGLCDAVGPGHLAAIVAAAAATIIAVRLTDTRNRVAKLIALLGVALIGGIILVAVAPNCLSDPYGTMDPVVRQFWFYNVLEGLPIWRQDAVAAASIVAFPLVGLFGSIRALRAAQGREAQRRWWITLVLLIATIVVGILVRRAAFTPQCIAIPGVLTLLLPALRYADQQRVMLARVGLSAALIIGLSPFIPVILTFALVGKPIEAAANQQTRAAATLGTCSLGCEFRKLNQVPATTMLAGIDLGPPLLAWTQHSAYGAGYHRLQRPMRDEIDVFAGTPDHAKRFLASKRIRYILIAPDYSETAVYMHYAPKGFISQLVADRPPQWLERVNLGTKQLRLYRVRAP